MCVGMFALAIGASARRTDAPSRAASRPRDARVGRGWTSGLARDARRARAAPLSRARPGDRHVVRSVEVEDAGDLFLGDVSRRANVTVIGGRGCGKSSVCRRLAASDKRFKLMCLDDLIVYEAGKSIPDVVAERGWGYFRDLEYEVCVKAGRAFDGWTLIDAGGGVVTDLDENGEEIYSERKVAALKQNGGLIVFLDREVDYLCARIEGDANRPDLSASKSFREIMARRLPWYRRAADLVIDGGGSEENPAVKKKKLASSIAAWYYNQTGEKPLEGQWFELDIPRAKLMGDNANSF